MYFRQCDPVHGGYVAEGVCQSVRAHHAAVRLWHPDRRAALPILRRGAAQEYPCHYKSQLTAQFNPCTARSPYTVDLVIFACVNFRQFPIFGFLTGLRIRKFPFFFSSAIIKIIFARFFNSLIYTPREN